MRRFDKGIEKYKNPKQFGIIRNQINDWNQMMNSFNLQKTERYKNEY